jgi:hypothetical protein
MTFKRRTTVKINISVPKLHEVVKITMIMRSVKLNQTFVQKEHIKRVL